MTKGSDITHPLHHDGSLARKFGGGLSDYQAVHDWFDASKGIPGALNPPYPARPYTRHLGGRTGLRALPHQLAGRETHLNWIGEQRGGKTFSVIPFVESGEREQEGGAGLSLVA